jgi:hypothetical protein
MASPAFGGGGIVEVWGAAPVYAADGDGTAPGWGAGGVCVVDVAVSGEEVVGVAVAVWVGCAAVAPGWGGAGAELGSAVV